MKFNDIAYQRPDIKQFEVEFKSELDNLKHAGSFDEQDAAFVKLYKMRDHYGTMFELAEIRYHLDTGNEEYKAEMNYFDEISPNFESLINLFYQALNAVSFKDELQNKWGEHILNLAQFSVDGFQPAIMEDMKTQNKLTTQYTEIRGSAQIDLNGETLTLAGLRKYQEDSDRGVREQANEAKWNFFAEKQEQLDGLFDQMVKVRHSMAQKMGHENFIKLGYNWMGRIDYTESMVENFRKQVVEEIVPITRSLRQRQMKRLNYSTLEDYDLNFDFLSGNPEPKGGPDAIVANGQKMYRELSPETAEFYDYLLKYDLMDLTCRPGKNDGGFCSSISDYRHPFIFANFNGTSADLRVLTHEAGHAFQYFRSRHNDIIEYRWPSSESAEIHSMSMEHLTYPWMKEFFEEDTDKYLFSHMDARLRSIPYLCANDHFQHIIYKNPEYSPDQRAEVWKEMRELYLPDHKMDTTPYLRSGRFWQSIMHIYQYPFYMIDYALAQICAFQFWQKANYNREETWKDYLRLCNAGGTKPFLQLVELAGLKSPFEEGCVKGIAGDIVQYLDTIDDSQF